MLFLKPQLILFAAALLFSPAPRLLSTLAFSLSLPLLRVLLMLNRGDLLVALIKQALVLTNELLDQVALSIVSLAE